MLMLQKCVAGDVILSEKGDIQRRMATVPELRCVPCQRVISQGRYYRKLGAPVKGRTKLMIYFQTAPNVARVGLISVKTAIGKERHASSLIHTGCTPTFVQTRTRHILLCLQMAYAAKPAARTYCKALSIVSD